MTIAKVEITDDLVQRFLKVIVRHGWRVLDETPEQARKTLDELLNPPLVDEIPVSEEMRKVGAAVQQTEWLTTHNFVLCAENTYRAMERVRRADRIPLAYLHGVPLFADADFRRKDDPK